MANSAKNTANVVANNEVVTVSQSATAKKSATTQRVVETRDMWAVVFDHTATLLALTLKGEELPSNAKDGFAFGKMQTKDGKTQKLNPADQPHIRGYALSLLAGFTSRKATKAINKIEGCPLKGAELEEMAKAVFHALYPKGDFANKVGKAEPKQAKSLVEAVIAKL